MTQEDYCSYEVAKLLKEKGFDWECEHVIWDGADDNYENYDKAIPDPSHQMAMKWLREKGIYFSLVPFIENVGWPKDIWHINFYNSDGIMGGGFPVKGYEEAVEAALKYSLENLI